MAWRIPFFSKMPGGISRRSFRAQRAPRRGTANPERFDMPLWELLVREGWSAYEATQRFRGPSAIDAGAGWCFMRYGCSKLDLGDGRVVYIAGEHEDSYDPDFYIYNDVIVRHEDGGIEIFGYPEEVFPPTDFHSATRLGDSIWLVGSLSYPENRRYGETQVCLLDLRDLSMHRVETHGEKPGWLYRHRAEFEEATKSIVVEHGVIERERDRVQNVDEWALNVETLAWTRRTTRVYEEWSVRREDAGELRLFDPGCAVFEEDYPRDIDRKTRKLYKELGVEHSSRARFEADGRNYDRATFEALYVPDVAHEAIDEDVDFYNEDANEDEDDGDVGAPVAGSQSDVRIAADRVIRVGEAELRYDGSGLDEDVRVRIFGSIAPELRDAVLSDLVRKLTQLQGVPCRAECVRAQP